MINLKCMRKNGVRIKKRKTFLCKLRERKNNTFLNYKKNSNNLGYKEIKYKTLEKKYFKHQLKKNNLMMKTLSRLKIELLRLINLLLVS